jgi:transaldolase
MKLFVDTANLEELEECLQRGFACGVTLNPALLAREDRRDFRQHINDMIDLLKRHDCSIPLSVPVLTPNSDDMLAQAEQLVTDFGHYPHLNIKVPIGWDELRVVAALARRGVAVNCTCCMSFNQAMMAAGAGARYVSLFWGRIRDIGYDAGSIVQQVAQTFRIGKTPAEIIVGSIRHIADVNEAIQAGADILTVPPRFFAQMCTHPKSDEAAQQLIAEFRKWQEGSPVLSLRKSA